MALSWRVPADRPISAVNDSLGSPNRLGQLNRHALLRELRVGAPLSRALLAERTGISKPAVTPAMVPSVISTPFLEGRLIFEVTGCSAHRRLAPAHAERIFVGVSHS